MRIPAIGGPGAKAAGLAAAQSLVTHQARHPVAPESASLGPERGHDPRAAVGQAAGFMRVGDLLDRRLQFGFVMLGIEDAAHGVKAVGSPQFPSTVGRVTGSAKLFGIDERFDWHDRVSAAGLPVGAQAVERQAQGAEPRLRLVLPGRSRKRQFLTTNGKRHRRCSSLRPIFLCPRWRGATGGCELLSVRFRRV